MTEPDLPAWFQGFEHGARGDIDPREWIAPLRAMREEHRQLEASLTEIREGLANAERNADELRAVLDELASTDPWWAE